MPTGYTYPVSEQDDFPFEEFVWSCARGFGALVLMRDDPQDAPIPEFEPDDFYATRAAELRKELAQLAGMSPEAKREGADAAYRHDLAFYEKLRDEKLAKRRRYECMLAKVRDWKPPTCDHAELKRFMADQLEKSIEFDCYEPEKPKAMDPDAWWEQKVAQTKSSLERAEQSQSDEIQRTKGRNAWVQALNDSVPMPKKLRGGGHGR